MIYIPWKVYRKTDNIGFAFIAFLFCVGATPFIAWIFFYSLLKDWQGYDSWRISKAPPSVLGSIIKRSRQLQVWTAVHGGRETRDIRADTRWWNHQQCWARHPSKISSWALYLHRGNGTLRNEETPVHTFRPAVPLRLRAVRRCSRRRIFLQNMHLQRLRLRCSLHRPG